MTEVLKPKSTDNGGELATIKPKSLSELLAIGDTCPSDFYKNPDYLERVKSVTELAKTLVHTIDDQGRADSKKDAAAIRKYAKTTDSFALGVFRSMSDKFKIWRDSFTVEIKELNAIADGIDAKFKKMEEEKLVNIGNLLAERLDFHRTEKGIKESFYALVDLRPMLKLSGSLTDKGVLTAKADNFVKAIADGELAHQNKTEMRLKTLENRCLRADINPPLAAITLGNELYGTDEEFDVKVDALIASETERKAEIEARIYNQNQIANQKKIDDALKAQSDEANRKAREDANAARLELAESTKDAIAAPTPEKTPDDLRRMASSIAASAERAPTNEVRNREMEGASKLNRQADELEKQQQQMAGKKVVTVTAQFQITVRSHITPQGVADHLKSKLPDELVAVLVACSGTE